MSSRGSDHQVFSRARVPGVLVQWSDVRLHSPEHTAATVDMRHLKGAGDAATIVARDLAGAPQSDSR